MDGPDDVFFISQVFPDWAEGYQLITRTSQDQNFIKYAKNNRISIAWLRDREFVLPEAIEVQLETDRKKLGIPVFAWDLPCIESYLILNTFLNTEVGKNRERFFKYTQDLKNGVQYYLGVTQGLKQLSDSLPVTPAEVPTLISKHWTRAQEEINSESPDWKIVVEVIHGHTWWDGENKHAVVRQRTLKEVQSLHSDVLKLLNNTRDLVTAVLGTPAKFKA